MRILFLTAQSFHPEGRKASTHFLASGLHKLGHQVYVLTVGASLVRIAMAPQRNKGAFSYRSWKHDPDGLWKRVNIDLVHRPARDRGALGKLLGYLSSNKIRKSVLRQVATVDAVVLASGLAVVYYDFIRRTYPSARILYNAADYLSGVGYSGSVLDAERKTLSSADVVRTPSALLAKEFPSESKWILVPHGVDKTILLQERPSPYPPESSNAILVGSTLLDWGALLAIANAVPDTKVHVFGVADRPDKPQNLVLYGEVAFDHLVPYLQHASCALAPYKLSASNAYIAESSLKVRQYRVCGLPIICPTTMPIEGNDIFQYDPDNYLSVKGAIVSALLRGKQPFSGSLPDWSEVAVEVESLLRH